MYMVFQVTDGTMVFLQSFPTQNEADACVAVLSPERPSNTYYIVLQGTIS